MKFRSFTLFGLLIVGAMLFVSACTQTATSPTSLLGPGAKATSTPTATLTYTPTPVKYEDFEDGTWATMPSWLVSSIGGSGGGSTGSFTWSTTKHGGVYSLQTTVTYPGPWSEGYVGFGSAYGSGGAGGPMDVRIGGNAPGHLSIWIYSAESTTLHFGLWDSDTNTYTTAFNPPTPFIPAATWTNVVQTLSSSDFDGNYSGLDYSAITYVLVGANDLTGAAHSADIYIDDVYFTP